MIWVTVLSCQVAGCGEPFDTLAVVALDGESPWQIRLCRAHGDLLEAGPCSFYPATAVGTYVMETDEERECD